MPTNPTLDQLSQLAANATGGTWVAYGQMVCAEGPGGTGGYYIAQTCDQPGPAGEVCQCDGQRTTTKRDGQNAAYIAAICNAGPRLIRAVESALAVDDQDTAIVPANAVAYWQGYNAALADVRAAVLAQLQEDRT